MVIKGKSYLIYSVLLYAISISFFYNGISEVISSFVSDHGIHDEGDLSVLLSVSISLIFIGVAFVFPSLCWLLYKILYAKNSDEVKYFVCNYILITFILIAGLFLFGYCLISINNKF
jgi:hypothetical protein